MGIADLMKSGQNQKNQLKELKASSCLWEAVDGREDGGKALQF